MARPTNPRQLEREFWARVPSSASVREAGAACGVSNRVVLRWMAESGGVKPRLSEPTLRLSFEERCQIEAMCAVKMSVRAIAARLGRSPSTISREIRRNRTLRGRGGYGARNAQHKADQRARRPKPTKLAGRAALREQVQDRLLQEHSPKQIVNRLRLEFPDDPEMRVSTRPSTRPSTCKAAASCAVTWPNGSGPDGRYANHAARPASGADASQAWSTSPSAQPRSRIVPCPDTGRVT